MKRIGIVIAIIVTLISCGPRPKIYTQNVSDLRLSKSIAVLPFANFSGTEDAGRLVYNAIIVDLLKKRIFRVLEPGEVDKVLREERVRITDKVDLATLEILRKRLQVDYLMVGSVNEYDYQKSQNREVPRIGITLRIIDINTGQIAWAANHNRKGDDSELIFGWRTISSISRLTSVITSQIVNKIKIQ